MFRQGLTLVDDKLVKIPFDEYGHTRLYDMLLGTDGPNLGKQIVCSIAVGEGNVLLEGNLRFSKNQTVDPGATIANWHRPGEENNLYPFLIPKDPMFISNLKFSFTTKA